MWTFARFRSPPFGRGKVSLQLTNSFNAMAPIDQMNVIQQAMKIMRKAYDDAERAHAIRLAHEDARNAEYIRPHANDLQK
jgi:hypothetical protein